MGQHEQIKHVVEQEYYHALAKSIIANNLDMTKDNSLPQSERDEARAFLLEIKEELSRLELQYGNSFANNLAN